MKKRLTEVPGESVSFIPDGMIEHNYVIQETLTTDAAF